MENNAKPRATVGWMRDQESFHDRDTLIEYCAQQMRRGRLALVLGAGVSVGFGLPNWNELMNCAFRVCNKVRPDGLSNEDAADYLLNDVCHNDEVKFARTIHEALYKEYGLSPTELVKRDLLISIGAMTMASVRGGVRKVVSFNFDDLLEVYLQYLGVVVRSVDKLPAWEERADVTVFHPHGLLPSMSKDAVTQGIVLAQIHYDRIVGKSKEFWRHVLLEIMSSNTCLFIGLSGSDSNLTSVLADVNDAHVCRSRGDPYWGIRFSDDPNDSKRCAWAQRGVVQHTLGGYSELPEWLFDVCRLAANLADVNSRVDLTHPESGWFDPAVWLGQACFVEVGG